jgi:N-acetylglucosamine-6-phosphate deacetylase
VKPLLIKGVTVLSEPLNPSRADSKNYLDILIENGKIALIGRELKAASEYEILEANGLLATPGWIDIQLNGAFGYDFTEDPDSIWQAARELPKLGTTSFLPTIITSPLEKVAKAIMVQKSGPPAGFSGAQALGLHLEGPFLNPGKKGAHNPKYLLIPSPALISGWTRANGVILVTLAPELDNNFETIRHLRKQDVAISMGHSLSSYEQAKEAFLAGVQCSTHLFNAQTGIDRRQPGLSIAVLTSQEIYTGIIIDGIHVHPAMINLAWKCKGSRRLITVTDAISALGMPPGKYNLGDFEIYVTETQVTLNDGTLAGSNITQQKSLLNLMAWTGCSLYEAIRTVTATPAEFLGLANKGKIVPESDADLVLVDSELNIKATIVGGVVLYNTI